MVTYPSQKKGNYFMELTLLEKCKSILKTLPIAYYLRVKTIPVIFDNKIETSCFIPSRFEIRVAFKNIEEVFDKKVEMSEEELEKTIRCFLYHEVSHAILTPYQLMDFIKTRVRLHYFRCLNTNLANILEDERIESILKDYYLDVNFKENFENIATFDKDAKCFEHFVFNAVRFRYAPSHKEEINKRINDFIIRTRNISARDGSVVILCEEMEELLLFLETFWKFEEDTEEDKSSSSEKDRRSEEESEESSKESGSEEENEEKSEESEKSEKSGEDSIKNNGEETFNSEDIEKDEMLGNGEGKGIALTAEEVKDLVEAAIEKIKSDSAEQGGYLNIADSIYKSDFNTRVELSKIIAKNVGFGTQKSNAKYGYCGRLDSKKIRKDYNDSYKWFKKKSSDDQAKAKKSSKKILNIWLDQSGSFRYNDEKINKVLKALYEIENKRDDFEWNLIKLTCECHLVEKKEERVSRSWSGNALPKKQIEDTYKRVNKTHEEFNIVLFDGWATSNDFMGESKKADEVYGYESLKVFNNKRTIFITECSNTKSIQLECKDAKAIIEENSNYAITLAQNIIKALDLLF